MKTKEEFKPNFLSILTLSCIIFTPLSFLISVVYGLAFTPKNVLQLPGFAVIFPITFIIALIIVFLKEINYKKTPIGCFSCTYTALTFILSTFVMFVSGTTLWSLYSVLLITGYSLIVTLIRKFIKLKSYLLTTVIYYAASVISFLILIAPIGGYSTGNQVMLSLGIFTACYAVASMSYFLFKRSMQKCDNEDMDYKPMFD